MSDQRNVQTPAVLGVTEHAVQKIQSLRQAEGLGPEHGLRVGVTGGGCSGFTYMLEFDTARPDDNVVEVGEVRVFVDPRSTMFVRGSVLDYEEGLMGSGFKIRNPNVKGTCGCGHSFEV